MGFGTQATHPAFQGVLPEDPDEPLQRLHLQILPEMEFLHPQHPEVPGEAATPAMEIGDVDPIHPETRRGHLHHRPLPQEPPEVTQGVQRHRIAGRKDIRQGIGPGEGGDEFGR